jgi:hypothetical protein
MKRYCLVDANKPVINASGVVKITRIGRPNMPAGPGRDYGNSTPSTASGGVRYNYMKMNYIRYFMGAYVGYKGGVRYKYVESHTGGINSQMIASRNTRFLVVGNRAITDSANLVPLAATSQALTAFTVADTVDAFGTTDGCEITDRQLNGCVEFELPWMSSQRFQFCHELIYTAEDPANMAYSDYQRHNHFVRLIFDANANSTNALQLGFAATAEDFSFFFFINAPITYTRIIPAPP